MLKGAVMTKLETKVIDDYAKEFERMAGEAGCTVSDALRKFVELTVCGHYNIYSDDVIPSEEYLAAIRPYFREDVESGNF